MRAWSIVVTLCVCAAWADSPKPARTWITNVTIVSPESLDRVTKGSVLIEDGRIAAVRRSGDAIAPGEANVVDGDGGFLIPGLIDSHVHVTTVPGEFQAANLPVETKRAYFEQLPRSYLYYGFTTLVDLLAFEPQLRERFRREPLHPDLYDCGDAVVVPGGYPSNYFPEAMRERMFPNVIDLGEHTPQAAVARVKAAGGICVKTFIERGFAGLTNLPIPDPALLAGLRAAAAAQGLPLVVHANGFEAQAMALDAGADVIAHGLWNWGELSREADVPPPIAALLDRIASRGVGWQPTIQVLRGTRAYFDPGYLDDPRLRDVLPAALIEWYKSPGGQAIKKELARPGQPDAEALHALDPVMRHAKQTTRYLAAKHAKLLFGTDTPSGPFYGNLPGLNGYLELRNLREADLSLEQILCAATIENARAFHLDRDVGTIEPGKVANLLLLRKSPLESTDAYDSIVTVWIHGTAVPRERLSASPARPSPPAAR